MIPSVPVLVQYKTAGYTYFTCNDSLIQVLAWCAKMVNLRVKSKNAPFINYMGTILVTTMKKHLLHLTWLLLILVCAAFYIRVNTRYNFDHSTAHVLQENSIIAKHASNNPCLDNPPRNQGVQNCTQHSVVAAKRRFPITDFLIF
jgi:hypothetical protein